MANYKTGAQRYNDRMDKIFKKSVELGHHTLHGTTEAHEKKKHVAKKMKPKYMRKGFLNDPYGPKGELHGQK